MTPGSADIYVSYARKDEPSRRLIDKLRQAAASSGNSLCRQSLTGELEEVTANIRLDEEDLRYGESILGFMDKVAESEHLILLISDAYLRSPYCLYECVSAFNAIENRYWPSVVFIANDLDEDEAILYFDEKGLPHLSVDALEKHWQCAFQGLDGDDPARRWYQKNKRMARELEAWLIGRRWANNPVNLLTVWKGGSMVGQDEQEGLDAYLSRALNPIPNAHRCPSTDKLRDQSITAIVRLLKDNRELVEALDLGATSGNDGLRRKFVEEMLDDNPAIFIAEKLAGVFDWTTDTAKLNHLRKAADRLFGELVKYGVQIDTVHHQLQRMNQTAQAHAPISVSSECVLPEMADAFFRNRPAAYREVSEADGVGYVGKREFSISKDNILESGEVAQDAVEALSQSFLVQAAGLFYVREDGRPRQKPGPKLLRQSMVRKMQEADDFVIRITGEDEAEARVLTKKLKTNSVLRDVPIYIATGEQDHVIETSGDWYDAIFSYYEARDQNGN